MWFSSGGTKSVLHNDDVDNINCLFSGTKELLFIDYKKYKDKVCWTVIWITSLRKQETFTVTPPVFFWKNNVWEKRAQNYHTEDAH